MKDDSAQALRDSAARHDAAKSRSEDESDTDGFLSQWAHGLTAQEERQQAEIVDAGGVATFAVFELHDLDGAQVDAKLINGKYGPCWALLDDAADFTGEFISAHPKRVSTMERKGYREVERQITVPAKAKIRGSGTGLAGAASCFVAVVPVDPRFRYDRLVCVGKP